LRHASAVIVTLDREGTITYANQTPAGKPLGDMIGRCAMNCLPAATHEESLSRLRAIFRTARVDHYEYALPNGRWHEIQAVPVIDGGEVTTVVATVHDITRRKRIEERSRRRLADLAHVHRLNTMGKMVAELAHEIGQPLYAIANYAHASAQVVRQGVHAAEVLEWLDRISEESRRVGAIIRQLTSVARKGIPRRRALDLNALIARVIELTRPRTRQEQIEVVFVPAAVIPRVVGDRVQIEQVIVNLVHNAVDAIVAAKPDCRRLRVEVCRDAAHDVRVSVRDTGGGVAPEDLHRVFTPFFTTKHDGMGMGLAICRSIVEDHGGHIRAARHPDGGSIFSFTLPLSSLGQSHAGTTERLCRR
jgi:two-component system, LuxR family, sensor kinase FixL